MCALRAARKENAVPRLELELAVGVAERRMTGYDDEQLVVSKLVVVGERLLARWKLVEARAEVLARDALPTPPKTRLFRRPRPLDPPVVVEQVHLRFRVHRAEV